MKFDRDVNNGEGKYALLNLRKLRANDSVAVREAVKTLARAGVVEFGREGEKDEFFVVKLRDVYAPGALLGYAARAANSDLEWSQEVRRLAARAGGHSPFCKKPD